MDQAFPAPFCVLQVIKNWTMGRPGKEATNGSTHGLGTGLLGCDVLLLVVEVEQSTFQHVRHVTM